MVLAGQAGHVPTKQTKVAVLAEEVFVVRTVSVVRTTRTM